MRKEIAILAGPRGWDDNRESWLNKASKAVPTVTYRTVKALWYGEIKDPDNHWAAREIRRAVAVIEGQREQARVARQLEGLLAGPDSTNPALDRASIASLLSTLRAMRGQDSTGTGGSVTHTHPKDPPR
jgi:hypothetical protein